MDEKIIKLDIKQTVQEQESSKQSIPNSFFHTNPILQKMLNVNLTQKKGKFTFKDLFR